MKHLKVYQLATELYREVKALHMTPIERDQLERAVLSVVLNIAEGSGKPTKKDRLKFFHIAMGSTREVQALLHVLDFIKLQGIADHMGALLYKLIQNPGAF